MAERKQLRLPMLSKFEWQRKTGRIRRIHCMFVHVQHLYVVYNDYVNVSPFRLLPCCTTYHHQTPTKRMCLYLNYKEKRKFISELLLNLPRLNLSLNYWSSSVFVLCSPYYESFGTKIKTKTQQKQQQK